MYGTKKKKKRNCNFARCVRLLPRQNEDTSSIQVHVEILDMETNIKNLNCAKMSVGAFQFCIIYSRRILEKIYKSSDLCTHY